MSDTGAGDPVEVPVELELTGSREFEAAMEKSLIRGASRGASKGFERIRKDIESAVAGGGGRGVGAFKDLDRAAEAAGKTFNNTAKQSVNLGEDIEALRRRAEAMRDTLQKAGARPELFAVIDAELNKVLRLQAQFNERIEELANDPDKLRGYGIAFEAARSTIFREVSGINETLRTLSTTQDREGQRANLILKDQLREREQIAERARSEFVVNSQREAAQVLTETRILGQRRLQSERQFARTRIELLRFTLNQIRTIERAIGSVFSGTASIAAAGIRRIEGVAQRLGQVFTRGNREMNNGLQPALLSRERSIQRSFERQSAIINQAVVRQSRTIQRFERQASTGLAGAVTGRSAAGSLLGGGLAVGGGFLLLDRLRAGFEESVNLNESLNKTRQTFGEASADIEAFAANSVEALFVTNSAALEAAASFGIFGKAAGLTGAPLADFSKRLTVLATDLASFNNTQVDDAVTALAAALRGEQEPIRRYGILLNEAVLQQRAFDEGITESIRKLTPGERVLAAYNEILAQTTIQQGDAARTANDFANSSRRAAAASVETFAAIAGAFVPFATFLTNFSFVILPRITAFIEGNVGPGFLILRDALIGAGLALGGLLAARGVGEALKFLSIALRAVLTPMGLFLTAIAGIGAAFNVLRDRSPQFEQAIRTLAALLQSVLGQGVELVQRGLEAFGEFLDSEILPALGRFADFASGALRTALEFGIGFIINVVIPGLRSFGELITDTVLPALERFGRSILDRIVPALRFLRDTASSALDAIMPFLEPVIAGFERLGEVIVNAATSAAAGDFSGIVDGLRAFLESITPAQLVGTVATAAIGTAIGGPIGGAIGAAIGFGLGDSLPGIGRQAIDLLRPAFERVSGFVTGFFTGDRLEGAALGFLELVERIGRIVGSIISDPRFVAALEGIIAAAVATGFQFTKGFVQGVAENIPETSRQLARHLEQLFTLAFKEALDNPVLFAKIFAGIFLATAFLSAIRRNAAGAGGVAATGFIGGFTRTVRNGFERNQFASGFFGGIGVLEAAAQRESQRAGDALVAEQAVAARRLKALGQEIQVSIVEGIPEIDTKKQFDELEQRFGRAATQGALLRSNMQEIGRGISQSFVGVGEAISGNVTGGFDRIKAAGATLRSNIADLGRNLVDRFRETGIGIGQALGGAILSGVGAALSGQQLGTADTGFGRGIGLAGIVSSALFAGVAAGGGPVGVAVGGLVASVGLVTAAFAANGEAAKEAARLVDSYTDILQRHQTVAEALPDISDQISAAFQTESADVQRLLLEAGISADDLAERLTAGALDVGDAFALIGSRLDLPILPLVPFTKSIDDLRLALSSGGFAGSDEFNERLEEAGFSAGELLDLIEALVRQSAGLSGAIGRDQFDKVFNPEPVEAASTAVERLRANVATTADGIERGIGRGLIVMDAFGVAAIETGRRVLDDLAPPLDFVGQALEHLNEQRLAGISTQIDTVTGSLQAARDATALAQQALFDYLTGQFQNDAAAAIDQIVLGIPQIQSGIAEAVELGLDNGTQAGLARFRTVQGELQRGLAQAIQTALTENGGVLTPAQAAEALNPVRLAAEEAFGAGVIDARTRDTIIGQIEGLISDPTVAGLLEELGTLKLNEDQLEEDLADLKAQLPVDVIFSADQVEAALGELFPNLLIVLDPEAVAGRQLAQPVIGAAAASGPGSVLGAEARVDAELRAFLANAVARESVGTTGTADAGSRQVVIQGDMVGQKVEQQVIQTADTAERTADEVQRSFTARAASGEVQVMSRQLFGAGTAR